MKDLSFKINGKRYKFGTRQFPIADIKNIREFHTDNTEVFPVKEFLSLIDRQNIRMGCCYTNAYIIDQIARYHHIPSQYYAGWVFIEGLPPIHHAWVVVDGKYLIDPSINQVEHVIMKRIIKAFESVGKEAPRELLAKAVVEREKGTVSQETIMGKVPSFLVYVGSPDDMDSARKRFRQCVGRFKDHPCYDSRHIKSATPMQKIILDMKESKDEQEI